MIVRDAIEQWLRLRFTTGEIGSRTRTLYQSRLALLGRMFGDRQVSQIGRDEIRNWQRQIGRYSAATRRLYLSTVHTWLAWCVEEGLCEYDPTRGVPRIREPRRAPRARHPSEVESLMGAASSSRDRAIIALMVHLGLRCCEVARLEVADWDQRSGTLLVRGKAGHERVLPVPSEAAASLDEYRLGLPLSGPLVSDTASGRRPLSAQQVSGLVTGLMYRSGVKRCAGDGVTPHTLRHTAASDVLDRCGNVRTVQQMLGHSSLATTQIYLRRAGLDALRQAMEGRSYLGQSA